MKIAITGASGLIGSRLVRRLESGGHSVLKLVRREPGAGEARWDVGSGLHDPSALLGVEAAVHLAGESIASGLWTKARKREIRYSRVIGTRMLCESLARIEPKPRVLVAASAMGFYGDRGDEILDESSAPGSGFLPETCVAWEAACDPAREAGIRVAHIRTGLVLSRRGGALKEMLPLARLGLGGSLGSGRQFWSWITRDDLASVYVHALERGEASGPINAVAASVRQRDFAKALGRVLHRPAFLPAPAFALRLALGEMADGLLLASARMRAAALERQGFRFAHPELESALRQSLADAEW